MASLAGKTVMITGASKGIGKTAAIMLARAGANIVINYSSDDAAAQELVSSITSSFPSKTSVPSAVAAKADAGNPKELAVMVDKVVELYGKIGILICNAGIMPMVDLEHTTEETFDKVMKTNVKGPFFLAQVSYTERQSGFQNSCF
jgi:3-oxoacyl-[acyl-carrier protein] reductase